MPVEVILPKVDMDMSHGTLATWHVAEGETVAKGAPLFDIETDKAAMEVEAPASGRLRSVTAKPGDKVAVGTVVALIFAEGEAEVAAPVEPVSAVPVSLAVDAILPKVGRDVSPGGTAPVPRPSPASDPAPGLRATPAARAAARAAGLDLSRIGGTGPRGRIQRDDVSDFLARGAELPVATLSGMGEWAVQPGPLHISTRKGTGVPLVLLHGFTADSQSWAPLEKLLGPDRPLIRIDLPGHGRSPRRRLSGFAELARMVVEAFDGATRDVDRVDIVGHSLGGALALALADIRPRRIQSLALIAPAGLGPEIDARTLTGITRATRAESLAPWLRRLTATPHGISDDYARAAMRLRADPDLRACQAEMADILFPDGVQPFDLRPALSRLGCPTAILWGRRDQILPWRQALSVPGDFALHLLADAGHVPQIECPDRVARILVRHLSMQSAGG